MPVWRQAAERVRAFDLSLGDSARQRRDAVKRLETVPDVGPIVAFTAIAVFAEVSRLESAKHDRQLRRSGTKYLSVRRA